jgi:hypothetical protein
MIHQIYALHSSKSGKKHSANAFNGLRQVVHAVRGCKMALTRNIAYLYGLANGTRGTLVGVVYPRGAAPGDFPEAMIVDVCEYTGPAFYDDKCVVEGNSCGFGELMEYKIGTGPRDAHVPILPPPPNPGPSNP